MAKIYWRSIKRGSRTFESIPENLKPLVKELAMEDVANGTITAEEYEKYIGEAYSDEE